MEENRKNVQTLTPAETLNVTINTLESISIPASVLAVLSPAGIQVVMQQVVAPIQQAKMNLRTLLEYEQKQEEAAKAEAAVMEEISPDEIPEDAVVEELPGDAE